MGPPRRSSCRKRELRRTEEPLVARHANACCELVLWSRVPTTGFAWVPRDPRQTSRCDPLGADDKPLMAAIVRPRARVARLLAAYPPFAGLMCTCVEGGASPGRFSWERTGRPKLKWP